MVTAIVTVMSLALMLSGIVLRNALLLLSSALSWIFFAFLMFDYAFTNTAISTGLLLFGGFMTILCTIMALNLFMSGRKAPSTEDEQARYKKEVLNATRRR